MRSLIAILAVLLPAGALYAGQKPIPIADISSRQGGAIQSIRDDVRKSLYVIQSGRPAEELPDLKIFVYTVKRGDTFWSILARSSLDMDTLISLNRLSNPLDISAGRKIYLPNMRGIVIQGGDEASVRDALLKFKIKEEYVRRVNGDFTKPHLFVPCGKLSNLERSLFIGTGFAHPLPSRNKPYLSSGFGTRRDPFNRTQFEFHTGVDIACPYGSEALAARDGRVIFTGYEKGYGKLVVIEHEHGYRSYYGHLSRFLVKPGDTVKSGTVIALTGNTGRTTGPHLHFEVRRGPMPVHPGLLLKGR